MKISYHQIYLMSADDQSIIPMLSNRLMSAKVAAKMAALIVQVSKVLIEQINPKQDEMIKKYGKKNEKGEFVVDPASKDYQDYLKEFTAWLQSQTAEVTFDPLTMEDVKDEKFTPTEIYGLSMNGFIVSK